MRNRNKIEIGSQPSTRPSYFDSHQGPEVLWAAQVKVLQLLLQDLSAPRPHSPKEDKTAWISLPLTLSHPNYSPITVSQYPSVSSLGRGVCSFDQTALVRQSGNPPMQQSKHRQTLLTSACARRSDLLCRSFANACTNTTTTTASIHCLRAPIPCRRASTKPTAHCVSCTLC